MGKYGHSSDVQTKYLSLFAIRSSDLRNHKKVGANGIATKKLLTY